MGSKDGDDFTQESGVKSTETSQGRVEVRRRTISP